MDTIKAGCGLNDFNVVKFISENSSFVINDLIDLGVEFDKKRRRQSFFYAGSGAFNAKNSSTLAVITLEKL